MRIERLGVIEAEDIALERIADSFNPGDVEVRVGEVEETGSEVPAYCGFADICRF